MYRTILISAVIIACASLVAAQTDDYKKVELFTGYSYGEYSRTIGGGGFVDESLNFHGFNASITRNVSRYVGFKFDVSGHFNNRTLPFGVNGTDIDINSQLYNFLGGVQVKNNSSDATFKPFLHALVGVAHVRNRFNFHNDVCATVTACPVDFTENDVGAAGVIGGGIDIRVSKRIDIRLVQLDYNPVRMFGANSSNGRLSVGIVIH